MSADERPDHALGAEYWEPPPDATVAELNAAVEAWLDAPSGDEATNDRLAEAIAADLEERL